MGEATILMNAEQMARAIDDLAHAVSRDRRVAAPLALVGIRSRGVPLAMRIAKILGEETQETVPVGAIDITLYRDDLGQIGHAPVLRGTEVPFSVEGKRLVLVDDVLFTGRTVRAAMGVLCDLGRPAAVRLAVLIDRNHRELPIQPDYCTARIETERDEQIKVLVQELDGRDEVRRQTQ